LYNHANGDSHKDPEVPAPLKIAGHSEYTPNIIQMGKNKE